MMGRESRMLRCGRALDGCLFSVTFSRMKILRTSLLAAAVLLFAGAVRADPVKDEGFGDLTVDQVASLIAKKDADVFDNNGKDVYEKGHVPGAKWVAFNAVKESDLPKEKTRKLVFYCANPH